MGSAGEGLVTQKIRGNQGYDFDYRLLLHDGVDRDPKELRDLFVRKINLAIEEYNSKNKTNYEYAENRTQAMTVKLLNKENGIDHSFDFVIIRKRTKVSQKKEIYELLTKTKKNSNHYVWQERFGLKKCVIKFQKILKKNNYWEILKKRYLYLKNLNSDKISFHLYCDAINDVYKELYPNNNNNNNKAK